MASMQQPSCATVWMSEVFLSQKFEPLTKLDEATANAITASVAAAACCCCWFQLPAALC